MNMKKILVASVAVLMTLSAYAIPAKPGSFKYRQPDGSVIELVRHGDEYFHWTTTLGGQVVEMDREGYFRPSSIDEARRAAAWEKRVRENELRVRDGRRAAHLTHGERHIPVILVEYSNLSFTIDNPHDKFHNLLNQSGYSANGGTGSVRDYYLDMSHNDFQPVFDVYGPVKVSSTMESYGFDENLGNAAELLADAAKLLDSEIDFSNYDYDSDGYVDMILMYYPGHNPAEGGPSTNIWPHQSSASGRFDGKELGRYFCTSELKGSSGTNMCGIGTTCHEFAHSLGLPDFYDTNYETDGQNHGLFRFSLMDGGGYNNNGRTPPYLNAEEMVMLEWMDQEAILDLPEGTLSFGSVKDKVAYKSYTDTEGEYFLYECRDGSGWDSPLPTGLLVYHVDKSDHVVGGITARSQWEKWERYNKINAWGDHPCFYVVPAAGQDKLLYGYQWKDGYGWYYALGDSYASVVFPGSKKVNSYTPLDWNGDDTGLNITGITYAGGKVSLTAEFSKEVLLKGTVTDTAGNPLAGAMVLVTPASAAAPRIRDIRIAPRAGSSLATMTDVNGEFTLDLTELGAGAAVVATASMDGYVSKTENITLGKHGYRLNFALRSTSEPVSEWLAVYDTDLDTSDYKIYGSSSFTDVMGATRFSSADLTAHAGKQITKVQTIVYCHSADELYIIAETPTQRLLTYKVPDQEAVYDNWMTVDLSAQNLRVPQNEDLYVGYAVKGASYGWLFVVAPGGGNWYIGGLDTTGPTSWSHLASYDMDLVLAVQVSEDPSPDPDPEPDPEETKPGEQFAAAGFNFIDPGKSYTHTAGEEFSLVLHKSQHADNKPFAVQWQYDGQVVDGPSVTLTSGTHKVTAILTLPGGKQEVLEMELKVE